MFLILVNVPGMFILVMKDIITWFVDKIFFVLMFIQTQNQTNFISQYLELFCELFGIGHLLKLEPAPQSPISLLPSS